MSAGLPSLDVVHVPLLARGHEEPSNVWGGGPFFLNLFLAYYKNLPPLTQGDVGCKQWADPPGLCCDSPPPLLSRKAAKSKFHEQLAALF